jgi:hypothetical protein
MQVHVVRWPKTRIRYQNFDWAKARLDLSEEALDLGFEGQVSSEGYTKRSQFPSHSRRPITVLAKVGYNAGALAHEGADDFAADATRGAGDEHHPVGELGVHGDPF